MSGRARTRSTGRRRIKKTEVCLVLEGTYPYVSGGVSTWVHQIISALSEIDFNIFYIGAQRDPMAEPKYHLPDNVKRIKEVYLYDRIWWLDQPIAPLRARDTTRLLGKVSTLLQSEEPGLRSRTFGEVVAQLDTLRFRLSYAHIWRDRRAWDILCAAYEKHLPRESFIDFYWTVRYLLRPLWILLRAIRSVPKSNVYHSLSTGYAGLAAALSARHRRAGFLLSEHGIYVKERLAEIRESPWIYCRPERRDVVFRELGPLRDLWVEFFKLLAKFGYDTAHQITSLFSENARLQVGLGADPRTIAITPNGIDPGEFDEVVERRRAERQRDPRRKVIGFLGRMVAIKDVKTLIRAAQIVLKHDAGARFILAGPTDADPRYHQECLEMIRQFGIGRAVELSGPVARAEILAASDLMVLTSASEGLPFVLLEAFAAQLPVVATDVGACRELIEGKHDERPRLGPAGMVAPIGDPPAIAGALLRLLANPSLREEMGRAGRSRVEKYYTLRAVVDQYRSLYTGPLAHGVRPPLQSGHIDWANEAPRPFVAVG